VRSEPSVAKRPVRVLLLEDSDADADLIARELRRSTTPVMIERVDSRPAFIYALETFLPDVVLSDHSLGQFDSHAALELLRAERPATPSRGACQVAAGTSLAERDEIREEPVGA